MVDRAELVELWGEELVAKYGEELIEMEERCNWREGKCECPLCAYYEAAYGPFGDAIIDVAIEWARQWDERDAAREGKLESGIEQKISAPFRKKVSSN